MFPLGFSFASPFHALFGGWAAVTVSHRSGRPPSWNLFLYLRPPQSAGGRAAAARRRLHLYLRPPQSAGWRPAAARGGAWRGRLSRRGIQHTQAFRHGTLGPPEGACTCTSGLPNLLGGALLLPEGALGGGVSADVASNTPRHFAMGHWGRPKAPAPVPPASRICWVAPCCCPRGHLEGASQQTWHPTHPGISPWDTGAKSFCPLVPICTWTTWTCVCSGDSNHRGGCSCHRGGDASAPAPARETPLSRHFYRQFPGGNKKCRAPHGAKPSPAQGAARPSTNGELHLQRRQDAQPTVSPLARKNFCSHHFLFGLVWFGGLFF